ncbi:MAG: hypothetical protein V1787_02170 [Candidatus Micrarchaeota archaeon]
MAGGKRKDKDADADKARSGLVHYWANNSSLADVSGALKLDIVWRIRNLLEQRQGTGRKVLVLDSGCGERATAAREIAKRFAGEIREGRLEVHGLHLTKPGRDWKAFIEKHEGSGVRLHNLSANAFDRTIIRRRFDVIYDHFGAVSHAGNPLETVRRLASKLSQGGVLAFHVHKDGSHNPLEWKVGMPVSHEGEFEADVSCNTMHFDVFHLKRPERAG